MDPAADAPSVGLGYQHMLGAILATYVLIIGIPSPGYGGPLRVAALGGILLLALRLRRRSGRSSRLALGFVVFLFAVTLIVSLVGDSRTVGVVTAVSTAILVVVVMALTARSLIDRGVVDGPAVRGVLCVYLLFALLFGALAQFFGILIHDYLKGAGVTPDASESLYFSVITLTTVGYGDIVPGCNLARALAVAEALIGQLYLVSVVAAVVARFRPAVRPPPDPPDGNGYPPDGDR